MEKIIVTIGERFASSGKQILAELGEVEYLECSQSQLNEKIAGATILIVGVSHKIDAGVIGSVPNLKMIATVSTGTDHIDIEYARSKKIEVISLKDETEFLRSITSTAELALGLMIDLARNIYGAFDSVKRGEWNRTKFEGRSLSGKTLGIVGLGRLGALMAGYGKALNMEVIYTDPSVESRNFERVSFFDLLERSDAVSIHAHLCEATVNLFNSDAFMHMKSSSYLINTSRGKIVDENALILALESKDIAGYATDVIEDEYSGDVSPLVEYSKTHSNVIITPHIGGMTREARESTDVFMAKKIRDTLKAHEPASVS